MHTNTNTPPPKAAMRAAHVAARRDLRGSERKRELDQALVAATLACVDDFGARGTNIAAYNPLSSEPGPADFAARLAAAARTLFLPISQPDGVLAWAQHGTKDAAGALDITEPEGPSFTSNVLRSCGLVVAPALAVDRQGMRLGKGAGYYDRALAGLDVPVAAVVYDWEVVDAVPHDAHDQAVDAVITPEGFFRI
ncbi:5-formyltetrahydrofolate cyclo-ligase [Corynebacterium sp. ACRQP]|uniref:5-formyltetrahydrofolate cyclo-ligase n=1 Tax=Corynebacterium sp. ACRQP TaxID=2918195 RepID=UPI001EF40285|nr:5-formyltetrahydrofolate cyclo-ligase [Corynebacterium sp. ACRQP]MCG7236865.1 5-formyltetrahydrofolate cyclo-ligase [Corynebacterium sp. ACRQP]